jgi:hypothetical protein
MEKEEKQQNCFLCAFDENRNKILEWKVSIYSNLSIKSTILKSVHIDNPEISSISIECQEDTK